MYGLAGRGKGTTVWPSGPLIEGKPNMKRMTRSLIAVACACATGAAFAQSVQRDGVVVSGQGKATQVVAQASTPAPIQVAQAGGAATGASTGGAATGLGLGTSLIVVGAAVATIAVTVDSGSTTQH